MARTRLIDLAACVGGRWRIDGLGEVVIRDYHPATVLIEWMGTGLRWFIPLFDLRRIGEPLGRQREK